MSYDRKRKHRANLDPDDLAVEEALRAVDHRRGKLPRCPVAGKVIWRKRSSAEAAAKAKRRNSANPFLEVYPCEHCGGYHMGHAMGTQRMRRDLLSAVKPSPAKGQGVAK